MPTMEEKIADLERQIAAHKEELARLRGEPHKSVSNKSWQPIDYTENMRMPPSAAWEMAKVVPDDLIRQIVGDSMRKAPPTPPPAEPVQERGTGWQDDTPFPDRSREFELMDR